MLVKYWMSHPAVSIDVNDSMQDAVALMRRQNIRMLPVMKKQKLIGVITDRDIKRASASDATTLDVHELLYLVSTLKVKQIMSKKLFTVPEDYTIEETAELLMQHKISSMPVVDKDGLLMGVITQTDIFKAMISLSGASRKGVQFACRIKDEPGTIKTLTDILRAEGGRLLSILTSYDRVPEGYRKVYLRTYGIERARLEKIKAEFDKHGAVLYLIDHRENIRKIYSQ